MRDEEGVTTAMKRTVMIAALAAGLGAAGCAGSAKGVEDRTADSISYETGPCFGACPVYRLTVQRDGAAVFEGIRFTKVQGRREFRLSPARYRAFASRLAPLRPRTGDVRFDAPPRCERVATDLPSVTVRWQQGSGRAQSLYYYYGCDMEKNRSIAERLRRAPEALAIADLIKS